MPRALASLRARRTYDGLCHASSLLICCGNVPNLVKYGSLPLIFVDGHFQEIDIAALPFGLKPRHVVRIVYTSRYSEGGRPVPLLPKGFLPE